MVNHNSNPSNSVERKLINDVKITFLYALALSISEGMIMGLISIFQNQYARYSFYYLAFDELAYMVNRYLYVLIVSTVIFLVVLSRVRIWFRKKFRLTVFILVLIAICFFVNFFDLDHRINIVWKEMDLVMKLSLMILFLISADLIVGKQWLRFFPGNVSLQPIVGFLLIPVLLNAASTVWSNKLQKDLSEKPNILVLVVDALRADHVSCLGYDRETTPNIDALASEGILFTQAVSNSNATRFTVPSIFTLVFPSVHGITFDGNLLSSGFLTLAEILKGQGYATLAYMPNPSLKKKFNFDQGFDIYDDQILNANTPRMSKTDKYETAKRINYRFLRWLNANKDKRFFAYIHYRDAHSPYVPPSPYDTWYRDVDDSKNVRKITDQEYGQMTAGIKLEHDRNNLNYYLSQYDGEIRYIDDQVKYLLDSIDELGVLDDTIIFLTADHGEAFLEHGGWGHGRTLYDEMVHVPLIVKFPDPEIKDVRIDSSVHTFDISATILDILDFRPGVDVQAKSLLPLVHGEVNEVWDHAFVETPGKKGLRNAKWKLIQNFEKQDEELYNLQEDPLELNNLILQETELAQELRKKMRALVQTNEMLSKRHLVETEELDEETIEQLRSLGYLN